MDAKSIALRISVCLQILFLSGCGGKLGVGFRKTATDETPYVSTETPPEIRKDHSGAPMLTLSGFSKCDCFNGEFGLNLVSSNPLRLVAGPVEDCPGQSQPAYLKFDARLNAFGITSKDGWPGSGNSNYAPAKSVSFAPLVAEGGGSKAGNINSFCPGSEDLHMNWKISPQ